MKATGTISQIMVSLLQAQFDPEKVYICEVKENRRKRSLDANGYYWLLLHQYATWARKSDTYIHNDMISRFGQQQTEGGRPVTLAMLETVDWHELPYIHLRPTTDVYMSPDDLRMYRRYIVMRGSREYDTSEFSRLIDGLIQDIIGSDAPIETMTPAELATLKGYLR